MPFSETFILHDDGLFVKSFDCVQQQLTMTPNRSEAQLFALLPALEVVRRLGWLASKRLVVKAIKGAVKVSQEWEL
ncbi:MAG: hypothetical protein HC851_17600 [Acaryochloris sp. RU_4_1]|nr:hypothetical protein [Acaryochloris sp. RU_4_1]NJR56189.1 hypothetical protein [Acaryochloris sp. CRU_2_0]